MQGKLGKPGLFGHFYMRELGDYQQLILQLISLSSLCTQVKGDILCLLKVSDDFILVGKQLS